MSSQYATQPRPFNDERLPYSGRSLAANREPNQSDWRSNQGYSDIDRAGEQIIQGLKISKRGILAQMNGHRCAHVAR